MAADGSSSVNSYPSDPFNVSSDASHLNQCVENPASNNMLPTPAKTPRKKDIQKSSELQSAARVLFPSRLEKVDDAMPNKKYRRGRKNVEFTLDSSGEDEDSAARIQIFTDSKERIPELDLSAENPFTDRSDTISHFEHPENTGRLGKKTSERMNPHVQDAFNREEGMVYVLFTPDPDHPNLSSEETEIESPISPRLRSSARASVKPRLLFPSESQRREREFVEEQPLINVEDGLAEQKEETPVTPVKQSFTPTTPPATGHVTRSTTKKWDATNLGSSPIMPCDRTVEEIVTSVEGRPRKKTSPFDRWRRTKSGSSEQRKSRKRGAEEHDKGPTAMASKRVKPSGGV
ncbi:MAG: hypothetical protein Q9219_004538 [cf. Caloplaca sp. 3 TL-2023]